MSNKVINFPQANTDLENRKKEAIAKLSNYRGEVPSKNTIRSLPDVQPGQIFWVEMDHKAYLVADKNGKKLTIKALDETATISTGITIYDMNKSIISKEPLLDFEDPDVIGALDKRLNLWFMEDTADSKYLLYGRDIHYVTVFERDPSIGESPAIILRDCLKAVGSIISMDFNTSDGEPSVEIWIRTANSPAELLYLFPYDKGVVKI